MHDRFLTVKEAAEFLKLSPSTVYKFIHYKVLPYFKPHGKIYLREDDLHRFLAQGRVKATWELVEDAQIKVGEEWNPTS